MEEGGKVEVWKFIYQNFVLKISNWTEKTDPKKFVYEDLAIASYLLCLWKEEEKKTKRY